MACGVYSILRCTFFLQNLTSRIAFEKPEDPLQFMLNEIEKIQRGEKLKELCTTSWSWFSHPNNNIVSLAPYTHFWGKNTLSCVICVSLAVNLIKQWCLFVSELCTVFPGTVNSVYCTKEAQNTPHVHASPYSILCCAFFSNFQYLPGQFNDVVHPCISLCSTLTHTSIIIDTNLCWKSMAAATKHWYIIWKKNKPTIIRW